MIRGHTEPGLVAFHNIQPGNRITDRIHSFNPRSFTSDLTHISPQKYGYSLICAIQSASHFQQQMRQPSVTETDSEEHRYSTAAGDLLYPEPRDNYLMQLQQMNNSVRK